MLVCAVNYLLKGEYTEQCVLECYRDDRTYIESLAEVHFLCCCCASWLIINVIQSKKKNYSPLFLYVKKTTTAFPLFTSLMIILLCFRSLKSFLRIKIQIHIIKVINRRFNYTTQ